MSDDAKRCMICDGWPPDHQPGCEMAGFPVPEPNGRYDARKVLDFVKTRNMERAEALIETYGTDAMIRMPWD